MDYGKRGIIMTQNEFKDTEIGKIPVDWEVVPLLDLISDIVDNRGKTAPTSDTGIALIATNCIKEGGLYPVKEKIRYVSEETFETWFRAHPIPNDIIIVNKGTPGLVCLVPEIVDFCIAQDMVALRPNISKIYGKYLFAYLRSKYFKKQVDGLNVGTTIPHLKKTLFPKLLIPVPKSLEEQKAIGNIYYNLSKKIENNNQQNKILEEALNSIFKEWFVNFNFLNKNRLPYFENSGEMEFNEELGIEIPKGWNVKSLDEIATYLNGLALQKYPSEEGNDFLPVIKIRELKNGITESTDKASPQVPKEYIIENGDVLFSWSGSLEVVLWYYGKGALNQHLFKVSSVKYPKWFYYMWTLHHLNEFKRIAEDKATTMGHIQRKHLKNAKVLVPNGDILAKMTEIFEPLIDSIINNGIQSQILAKKRDLLLPKLMSGEIRLK